MGRFSRLCLRVAGRDTDFRDRDEERLADREARGFDRVDEVRRRRRKRSELGVRPLDVRTSRMSAEYTASYSRDFISRQYTNTLCIACLSFAGAVALAAEIR